MLKFLVKLDRLAAWTMLLAILAYAISGYGMTKGIISPALASKIHLNWLGPIALVAFIIHTSFAIHLAFKRWRIWNAFTKILLIVFYLTLIGFLVYWQFFYQQKSSKNTTENSSVCAINSTDSSCQPNTTATPATISTEKTFTLEELKKYNGLNGMPAYAAVDGIVYDFSGNFQGGQHAWHLAGQDLSAEFHSRHSQGLLKNIPIIGKLK